MSLIEMLGCVIYLYIFSKVNHEGNAPVLCSTFSADGNVVFTGGADKAVRMWQLGQQPPNGVPQQIGAHNDSVKSIGFIPSTSLVVSGGWDGCLKFWDGKQSNPVHQVQLTDKVYDLDVKGNVLIVACANRVLYVFDVSGQPRQVDRMESPLKLQTRCVSVFPDQTGFAVGSIEGRVGLKHVGNNLSTKDFNFKCHRKDTSTVFSVNAIPFHNGFGTFATVGGDGVINFWDKENRSRLKFFAAKGETIPCATFNQPGNIFAYACSYDWSKGATHYNPSTAKNEIRLYVVKEEDIRPKQKKR